MKKRFIAQKEHPRLDRFLTEHLPNLSRTQVVRLIQNGHVQLNGRPVNKKNTLVQPGDWAELELVEQDKQESCRPPKRQLNKLFEDEYMLIIDKPCGISVHPGAGEKEETIYDIFRYYFPQIEEIKDTERGGIVHRLDKETSGILLLAKDIRTMRRLQKQFKRREVKKTYLALVSGHVRYRNGTIDEPIARSTRNRTKFRVVTESHGPKEMERAREAITEFSVLWQYHDFAYVKIFPLTGRTHQIRVHFSYFGNPVLGDSIYGKGRTFDRLALHAYSIQFYHPITGNMIYSNSPFPEIFRSYLASQLKTSIK